MNQHYEPGYDAEHCKDAEPARLCTHCGYTIEEDNPADLCQVCLEDSDDDCEEHEPDWDAPSLAEILELDHRRKEELR